MNNLFEYCVDANFPHINRDSGEGFTPPICLEVICQAIDKLPEHIQMLFNDTVLTHIQTRVSKIMTSPLAVFDHGTLLISVVMSEDLAMAYVSCIIEYRPTTVGVTRNVTALYKYKINI